ncbi:MAG: tetratricopeptide repeat protein, partial [Betaproteobacteria bacterium]|nr:tetratricopeptide repeat protein [Betaproteobacteria bacterium]
ATRWLEAHPDDVLVMRALGDVLLSRRELAGAERWYRRLLSKAPDDVSALNNLAWILGQRNDPGALAFARKAHELAPRDGLILDTLGTLSAAAGDLKAAMAYHEQAVSLLPDAGPLHLNYARTLAKAGMGQKALEQLDLAARTSQGSRLASQITELRSTLANGG